MDRQELDALVEASHIREPIEALGESAQGSTQLANSAPPASLHDRRRPPSEASNQTRAFLEARHQSNWASEAGEEPCENLVEELQEADTAEVEEALEEARIQAEEASIGLNATSSPLPQNSSSITDPSTPKLTFKPPRVYSNKSKTLSSPLVPRSAPLASPSQGTPSNTRIAVLETPPVTSQQASPTPRNRYPPLPPDQLAPFVRSSFPTELNPRSPIPHLHPTPVLRVCFRLGEALRAASAAAQAHAPVLTELYARVLASERDRAAQFFTFADLYYWNRPTPRLEGRWVGWKGVAGWERDGEAFLGDLAVSGKMCRAVGRIERKDGGGWRMCVLSAWAADWDDVEAVKQVVCA